MGFLVLSPILQYLEFYKKYYKYKHAFVHLEDLLGSFYDDFNHLQIFLETLKNFRLKSNILNFLWAVYIQEQTSFTLHSPNQNWTGLKICTCIFLTLRNVKKAFLEPSHLCHFLYKGGVIYGFQASVRKVQTWHYWWMRINLSFFCEHCANVITIVFHNTTLRKTWSIETILYMGLSC